MESKRQQKVARQLQKDLSDIIRRRMGDQFRNTIITVTRVQVSPDLSVARVHISALSVDKRQKVIDYIMDHKSEIRKSLGLKIGKQVRKIPELVFIEDHGSQYASEIDGILSKLNIPPKEE
ncbi:MAG: 30S ribosome-binding factor RbfA [Cyclobacteriaceae bacterium]|nr:30S ribosome-binding factor RbfA [Cyclobacteriaceae bacterium]